MTQETLDMEVAMVRTLTPTEAMYGVIQVLLVNDQRKIAAIIQIITLHQEFNVDVVFSQRAQHRSRNTDLIGNGHDFDQGPSIALHDAANLELLHGNASCS
ncbi:MAG: hypothetical protein JRJ51_25180 [Deltaproteobacteria bacterium]|nr:hypothetical protein [Deltaproteobacteria bacterium]